MYFNTMTAKNEYDSYWDRITQALAELYEGNLEENRVKVDAQNALNARLKNKRAPTKLSGPVTHREIVTWMGIRAQLLCDGTTFASNAITLGVIIRIANLVSRSIITWLTELLQKATAMEKDNIYHVLTQRYMTTEAIWWDKANKKSKGVLDSCMS